MSWLDMFKRKKFPPEAYRPTSYEGKRRVNPNVERQVVVSDFGDPDEEYPLQIFKNGKWEEM